jgi:rubrerythrin
MLASKGFEKVLNMSGGIRAWDNPVAVGTEEQGLKLFDGDDAPQQTLKTAYSLEAGLGDFYTDMTARVSQKPVLELFGKLSRIEAKHQDRLFDEYVRVSGEQIEREAFDSQIESSALEGGLTTQEYLDLFKPDLSSAVDVVSLAMSIEAQALDLYTRAAVQAQDEDSRKVLQAIAHEERTHLELLGQLL